MVKFLVLWLLLSIFLFPVSACAAQDRTAENDISVGDEAIPSQLNVKIGQVVRDCAECPEMVAVPQLGRSADDVGRIFYAGRFEITWQDYLYAVRDGACPVPEKSFGGFYDANDPKINDDYPITSISPDVFPCYLIWLSGMTGKTFRIPSGPEWEHITRAGTNTEYYWGDGLGFDNAIVFDYFDERAIDVRLGELTAYFRDDVRTDVKSKKIYPVGQFAPNQWGLFDTIGNASEITTEPFPSLPECIESRSSRVCEMLSARGNNHVRLPKPMNKRPPIEESLTITRYPTTANHGNHGVGFRVVRD